MIITIYDKEIYRIPYSILGTWNAYIIGLSRFEKDSGNLLIQFTDKFHKYKTNE